MISDHGSLPNGADPMLAGMLAYWRSKCRGDRLPSRRDIDATEIPQMLSSIFLLDVDGADFRFRLIGEDVVEMYGRLKGRVLREVMSGIDLARTLFEHRRCVLAGRPIYTRHGMTVVSNGDSRLYQRLLVPLADDDGSAVPAVTCLAGVMVFRNYWQEVRMGPLTGTSTRAGHPSQRRLELRRI